MTALPSRSEPLRMPDRLLTIEDYAALGETEAGYTELVEGRLLMSPSPVPDHNYASLRLAVQLEPQVPRRYEVIQDVDVDLELAPADAPAYSRRPDLMVVDREARRRVRDEGGIIKASDVLVVIEIVSYGSRRTDYVTKRGEYAEAGIQHYWIVDLAEPVSLVVCTLTKEFGYTDSAEATGTFAATEPFEVEVDLTTLL